MSKPSQTSAYLLLAASLIALPSSARAGDTLAERTTAVITPQGLQLDVERMIVPAGEATLTFFGTPPFLAWRLPSDGTWMASNVSLGDHGAQVFTENGALVNRAALLSALDEDPPVPAWEDENVVLNLFRKVDSSASGDIHVALHEEFADELKILRRPILRKYTSKTSVPDWTYESPILITNQHPTSVHVSGDGETIALLVYDSPSFATHVTVFSGSSGVPLIDKMVGTVTANETALLSADGSTLSFVSTVKLMVMDVASGTIVHQAYHPGHPQYGALALSGDGAILATGTLGEFEVWKRDASGVYALVYTHDVGHPTYSRRLALSADGSTLVAGLHRLGDKNTVRLLALDVDSQKILIDDELAGSGKYDNLVQEIQCSVDGQRFAVGLWGDEDGLVPEVLIYHRDFLEPIATDDLPGSVTDLSFSPDGRWLAVSSKDVHANQWGGGGAVSLYQAGFVDLSAEGVPRLGGTVLLHHHLREAATGSVLLATALADQPTDQHGFGAGLLYLDQASLVVLPPAAAGAGNVAVTPFPLPTEPDEVGTTYYFQAADLANQRLSANYLKVTVLP